MTNEEWREIFTKQLQEAQKHLNNAKTMRFKLLEKTASGEKDVTAQHIAWLQSVVDEYRKVLE
jgi:cellobiose-specific phosphotransferase system component IIA